MKNPRRLLIIFFLIITSPSFSQKLKKADRIVADNIQAHLNYLSDDKLRDHSSGGSEGERIAEEYVIGQFKKNGYSAAGDSSSWLQKFNIPDGREIDPASSLSVNGKKLILFTDFFPFAFSASKRTEASVVMELAENGVPWFVELKDLLDNEEEARAKDTSSLIRERAVRAAAKGATALFIYNNSQVGDLTYNSKVSVQTADIPVVYITRTAMKKFFLKESSIDVKLNIAIGDKVRRGCNVAAFADNKADSTVMITAHFDDDKSVAALMEASRLLKNKHYRFRNYLFIVFSGENQGDAGTRYFTDHPSIYSQKVAYALNFDKFTDKGLPAVKQSIVAINALKTDETKTRP